LQLIDLQLFQFKNYESLKIQFSEKINCFVGENGAGKTNLLDAIYYLSMTKSYFNHIDTQNIQHQQNMMMIKGNFQHQNENFEIYCGIQIGQKKIFKVNEGIYHKISEHIGRFPIVIIAPNDQELITEGSEARRKFLDSLLAQIDRQYLENLMAYNHYLAQRNAVLKSKEMADSKALIEIYDEYLLNFGRKIAIRRQALMIDFLPIFQKNYDFLVQHKEKCFLEYKSDFIFDNYQEIYRKSWKDDILYGRTHIGTHKDDLRFFIEKYPLKKYGSQGQQKSFLIALKLTQYEIIQQQKALKPLLLLDDIFDKLDEFRIQQLVQLVNEDVFGQIFMTDARPERTEKIFEKITQKSNFFSIQNGVISNKKD
jgi:DNA replication and repair protein RecF